MIYSGKVAILGCGPAGLMAAHGARQLGYRPVIFTKDFRPSPIGGAQYLHESIPEITDEEPDGTLLVYYNGNPNQYSQKVYGEIRETSWKNWPHEQPIWNMRAAYDRLWDIYSDCIVTREIDPGSAIELTAYMDAVLSCIPPQSLCRSNSCSFESQAVKINYRLDKKKDPNLHTMIYNANEAPLWYRRSVIFQWVSEEFPASVPYDHLPVIQKPLSTNCMCLPEIKRLGRYGTWTKGVLINDAYHGAINYLRGL